jgi:hypothetical protein
MKKIGEYTLRGNISENDNPTRVILFDGQFDTAYRVVEFTVAGQAMGDNNANTHIGKLCTAIPTNTGADWHWDDNAEIAWSFFTYATATTGTVNTYSNVDPDNLVVEDLYIIVNDIFETNVNYEIRMEKYDITDSQGALAMVRNRSQA